MNNTLGAVVVRAVVVLVVLGLIAWYFWPASVAPVAAEAPAAVTEEAVPAPQEVPVEPAPVTTP